MSRGCTSGPEDVSPGWTGVNGRSPGSRVDTLEVRAVERVDPRSLRHMPQPRVEVAVDGR